MKKYLIITVLAGMFVIPAFGQEPDEGKGPTPPGPGAQLSYPPEHPAVDKHWKLAWGDDFKFFDSNKWAKGNYGIRKNGVPLIFLTDQVSVLGDKLLIVINNTKTICPPGIQYGALPPCEAGEEYDFRSGWVVSQRPYNTQYGYFEARIKFPYKQGWGYCPAFWTFVGWDVNAKNAAEIDICEISGGQYPDNTITTCVHTCYPKSDPNCVRPWWRLAKVHTLPDFTYTEYHTYAVEWNAEWITWYVDGKFLRTLKNSNFDNYGNSIVDSVQVIFGIDIEKDYIPPTSPAFSDTMYVDYLKVYQLKCGDEVINSSVYNFDNYDSNSVKKSITIGGNGASNTIANGKNVVMRAGKFIEIKGEFTVSLGASLYLDVNACNTDLISDPCGGMYDW